MTEQEARQLLERWCDLIEKSEPGPEWASSLETLFARTVEFLEQEKIPQGGSSPGLKVRSTDPETSKKAAIKNLPIRGTQRHRVLSVIDASGPVGMTADELSQRIADLPLNSISTRLSELKQGGLIEPRNSVTRKTRHGRDAEVLVVTKKFKVAKSARVTRLMTTDSELESSA